MSRLEEACEQMLSAQRSTLWGRSWDVKTTKGKKEAASWLADQVRDLFDVMKGQP